MLQVKTSVISASCSTDTQRL